MKKFRYLYQNANNLTKLEKENEYEGERVLYKAEDIKYEDEKLNKKYNTFFNISNFRLIIFDTGIIFDIPLQYFTNHYVKKPMLYGSSYINIDFEQKPMEKIPLYIKENIPPEELGGSYELPKWTMIKYRTTNYNIDEGYNILLHALKAQEWNISFKSKKISSSMNSMSSMISNTSNVSNPTSTNANSTPQDSNPGLGLGRTTNLMMSRLQENKNTITKSFLDIKLLKENANRLIEIAAQLRAKILNDNNNQSETQKSDINKILQNIGFIDPVTKETSGREYYIQLAKQISDFLTDFLKNSWGIISLIDAYHFYNRARGVNTISPKDMKIAVDNLKTVSSNIQVKKFSNDMTMLHTNDFKMQNLINKINQSENFKKKNYITVNDFNEITKIDNTVLGKFLLDEMIGSGYFCIDESEKDLRYYKNLFLIK